MADISLTRACGAYDHMEALSRGIVRANGFVAAPRPEIDGFFTPIVRWAE